MEDSRISKLPGELRNRIYGLVLEQPFNFTILQGNCKPTRRIQHGAGQKPKWKRVDIPKHMLALTATCRQIRTETSPLFYSLNTFVLMPRFWCFESKRMSTHQLKAYSEALGGVRHWLKKTGKANSTAVEKLTIDLGHSNFHTPLSFAGRQWWTYARSLESKILGPCLTAGAIQITFEITYLPRDDNELGFSTTGYYFTPTGDLVCTDRDDCRVYSKSSNLFSIKFNMPTGDKEAVIEEIWKKYESKLRKFKRHVGHHDCRVDESMGELCIKLKNVRDFMLNGIGKKYLHDAELRDKEKDAADAMTSRLAKISMS